MQYMLIPLNQHFDGGLGATGEAFEEAANLLSNSEDARANNIHLPINFLYRHAIELYLKSMIVILHRALCIPYGGHPHVGSGFVLTKGKWKPIHNVHSLATLWAYFLELTHNHKNELEKRCRTDWQEIPDGLDSAINEIEQADASSTLFRYPDERRPDADKAKSSWKPKTPEEMFSHAASGGKPVKAFLVLRSDDSISQSFQYDDAPLAELSKLLAETASILSGAHTGLRVELADGF